MSRSHFSSKSYLESTLNKLTKEQLVRLVVKAVSLSPEIEHLFDHDPDRKDPSDLVKRARKAISIAVDDPDWEDWHRTGEKVNYEPVRQALEALQMAGFSEEVLELGLELLEESQEQIETYDEDGEIVDEVSYCMDIVLAAYQTVDWPNHKKLLWLLDLQRNEEYYVTGSFSEELKKTHPKQDWSLVANALLERMDSPDGESDFEWNMVNDTIDALTKAGRDSEILDLCKKAALNAGDYLRLVELLLEKKNYDEAEEWIHKGMAVHEETSPHYVKQLREHLLGLRIIQKNWNEALFMQTEDFIQQASLNQFKTCRLSAEKLKIWPTIRPLLVDFISEGKLPWDQDTWPFQNRSKAAPPRNQRHPDVALLIDLAIYENNPAEVLKWYDKKPASGYSGFFSSFNAKNQTDAVASAVQDFAPERAISIWKELAEKEIAQTKPEAYQAAGRYLHKIDDVMKNQKMTAEWNDYIQSLRTQHRRKKRLMEILDELS